MISWCGSWRTNCSSDHWGWAGCGNSLRFWDSEAAMWKGLSLSHARQLQDAGSGHRTFPLCTPGPAFTTSVRRNLLHFNPIPKFRTKKQPPIIQLALIGYFLSFSEERPRLEQHGNKTAPWTPQNCPMDAVLPETHGASQKTQISHSKASVVFNFHQHSNSPTLKEN